MKKFKIGLITLTLVLAMLFTVACAGLEIDDLYVRLSEESNITVTQITTLGEDTFFSATRDGVTIGVHSHVGSAANIRTTEFVAFQERIEGTSVVRRGNTVIYGPSGTFFDFVVGLR